MIGSILTSSASAETHALAEAITALRAAPDGIVQLSRQMELLAARCAAYPQETRQLWDWFEAKEPCVCMDDDDYRAIVQNHLALLDDRIRLVQQVQCLAAEIGKDADPSLYEDRLRGAIQELNAQRGDIGGLWEYMNAEPPPPSHPLPTRAERLAAFERGEYEDVETILERVKNGGPVSKD